MAAGHARGGEHGRRRCLLRAARRPRPAPRPTAYSERRQTMTDSSPSAPSTTTAPRRVAVVGLGNMGGPMAANLVKAGHSVTGFDLVPAALEAAAAAAAGVTVAASGAEAARDVDIVVTMLPAGRH